MKMTFNKVIQLILMFYNLAVKHADKVSGGSAGNGACIYVKNSTLFMVTGYAAEKFLDADITNGALNISLI